MAQLEKYITDNAHHSYAGVADVAKAADGKFANVLDKGANAGNTFMTAAGMMPAKANGPAVGARPRGHVMVARAQRRGLR